LSEFNGNQSGIVHYACQPAAFTGLGVDRHGGSFWFTPTIEPEGWHGLCLT